MTLNIRIINYFKFFYYYVLHGINFFLYLCNIYLLALTYIMKNIVLYVLITLGSLLASGPATGQKPSIELLPTDHQHQHPEAMIDSICHAKYTSGQALITDTSEYYCGAMDQYKKEDGKKLKTGWHSDVFNLRRDSGKTGSKGRSEKRFQFFNCVHPVHLLFQITALK